MPFNLFSRKNADTASEAPVRRPRTEAPIGANEIGARVGAEMAAAAVAQPAPWQWLDSTLLQAVKAACKARAGREWAAAFDTAWPIVESAVLAAKAERIDSQVRAEIQRSNERRNKSY